jgi:hypothetical protein
MNEVVIPLKIQGIAQMKAELRELKGELANATDPAQMAALAQQAGVLTDKIKDTNEAVKVFASGSKFEQVSNGLGGIKDSLMSLDFEEAAEKSKTFATALGGISKADIGKAIGGITSMIGTLSKAFIKLGLTILMNPIFLIVAAVVAIIAVIALVLDSFGVLDDVINFLMIPINALIQGFKNLTDWLGLTQYAAEESAEKSAKAFEEGSVRINEATDLATSAIDRQIAEQKALGKNTYDLEVKRTYIVQWAANERLKLARAAYYRELALGDEADQEKLKKLRAQIAAENKLILDSKSGRQVLINTKETAENKKEEKKDKPVKDKPVRDKPVKQPKAKDTGGDEIQKEIDKARQANIDATLDAITVEKNAVEAKYANLIAKAVKYKKDTSELEILKMNELNNINLKDEAANKVIEDAKKEKAKTDAAEVIKLEDDKYLEIKKITAANEQDKVKQLALNADYEISVLQAAFDEKVANLKEGDALLIQLTKELSTSTAQITKDAKDKEVEIVKEAEDKKRAEQLKTADAALDYAGQSISAIEGISNLAMENKLKKVKKGSKEEEALLKKQFQLNKSMQLAGAIVDAGKAITASLASSPIAIGPIPNPAGIASLAFAAVTSATNIAKIASTTFTSGTTPSTNPPPPSTTAVVPSGGPNLFGQANTGSQVNAGGGTNNITVTAIVSETEITASQNHINNIQQNSVL